MRDVREKVIKDDLSSTPKNSNAFKAQIKNRAQLKASKTASLLNMRSFQGYLFNLKFYREAHVLQTA